MIPDGPIDQRRERRVEFLGEQDGPAERELKTDVIKWFEGEPATTVVWFSALRTLISVAKTCSANARMAHSRTDDAARCSLGECGRSDRVPAVGREHLCSRPAV